MTAARDSLYDRLVEVLGTEHALILMNHLPEHTPATRADVDAVRTELKGEIGELRAELKGEIADFRREVHADFIRLDDRIHGFYDALHAQTRVHVAASLGSAVTVAGLVFIAAQLV